MPVESNSPKPIEQRRQGYWRNHLRKLGATAAAAVSLTGVAAPTVAAETGPAHAPATATAVEKKPQPKAVTPEQVKLSQKASVNILRIQAGEIPQAIGTGTIESLAKGLVLTSEHEFAYDIEGSRANSSWKYNNYLLAAKSKGVTYAIGLPGSPLKPALPVTGLALRGKSPADSGIALLRVNLHSHEYANETPDATHQWQQLKEMPAPAKEQPATPAGTKMVVTGYEFGYLHPKTFEGHSVGRLNYFNGDNSREMEVVLIDKAPANPDGTKTMGEGNSGSAAIFANGETTAGAVNTFLFNSGPYARSGFESKYGIQTGHSIGVATFDIMPTQHTIKAMENGFNYPVRLAES